MKIQSTKKMYIRTPIQKSQNYVSYLLDHNENVPKPAEVLSDDEQDLLEYKNAMDLNQKLSVNANKFAKQKRMLLFGVLEKDEQNLCSDPYGNEDAIITGTKDDQ